MALVTSRGRAPVLPNEHPTAPRSGTRGRSARAQAGTTPSAASSAACSSRSRSTPRRSTRRPVRSRRGPTASSSGSWPRCSSLSGPVTARFGTHRYRASALTSDRQTSGASARRTRRTDLRRAPGAASRAGYAVGTGFALTLVASTTTPLGSAGVRQPRLLAPLVQRVAWRFYTSRIKKRSANWFDARSKPSACPCCPWTG